MPIRKPHHEDVCGSGGTSPRFESLNSGEGCPVPIGYETVKKIQSRSYLTSKPDQFYSRLSIPNLIKIRYFILEMKRNGQTQRLTDLSPSCSQYIDFL